MRARNLCSMVALAAALGFAPYLHAQISEPSNTNSAATAHLPFDPHDFTGIWMGDTKSSNRVLGSNALNIPEPPLTEWAKQHLLVKSISHDALGGTHIPGWDRPGHICPSNQDPCFSADPNGVPANDPKGDYPGKDCDPLSTPGMYDTVNIAPMELIFSPERVIQLFDYHREWRVWWLNKEHPKVIDPSYEGDSVAHWEGNTLVVDTIGYNDKIMITQNIGHRKSEAFHLVERFQRLDHDHLEVDMTLYDPKAWGDKSWPGFRKTWRLIPVEQAFEENYKTDALSEWVCSARENRQFDDRVTDHLK
jgi:hypothetical protein